MSIVELLDQIVLEKIKPHGDQVYHWIDFYRRVLSGTSHTFSHIELETIARCNRSCEVCPTSKYSRSDGRMDEWLFKKIVDELAEIDFKGKFSPHFYGEPLLDERLSELMSYVREKLPESQIVIWTNGDLLTKEFFEELIRNGIDKFIVSRYDENEFKLLDELEPKQRKKIRLKKFSDESYLFNRGGLINPQHVRKINKCYYPSNIVVIDYQGNVLLCCNDYQSRNVFGNLQLERLIDIWNKEQYKKIRKDTRKGKFDLEICKACTNTHKKP